MSEANKFNQLSATPESLFGTELRFTSRDHSESKTFKVPVGLVFIALKEYFDRMNGQSSYAEGSSSATATADK